MAKAEKKEESKSDAIRRVMATGLVKPAEIIEALAKEGVTVASSNIQAVKSQMGKGKKRKARQEANSDLITKLGALVELIGKDGVKKLVDGL